MKWNKITLEIREEVEDIVISTLRTSGLKVRKFRTNSRYPNRIKSRCL